MTDVRRNAAAAEIGDTPPQLITNSKASRSVRTGSVCEIKVICTQRCLFVARRQARRVERLRHVPNEELSQPIAAQNGS